MKSVTYKASPIVAHNANLQATALFTGSELVVMTGGPDNFSPHPNFPDRWMTQILTTWLNLRLTERMLILQGEAFMKQYGA